MLCYVSRDVRLPPGPGPGAACAAHRPTINSPVRAPSKLTAAPTSCRVCSSAVCSRQHPMRALGHQPKAARQPQPARARRRLQPERPPCGSLAAEAVLRWGPSSSSGAGGGVPGGANAPARAAAAAAAAAAAGGADAAPQREPVDGARAGLDGLDDRFSAVDGRLQALERTFEVLLHGASTQPPRAPARPGTAAAGSTAAGGRAGAGEAGDGNGAPAAPRGASAENEGPIIDIAKLQTSLSENINRGFLESVRGLRNEIMEAEWTQHGKGLAERKGVAQFEQKCADAELDVPYDAISKLYADPSDLSVLASNRLKLMARSCIQQAVDEHYCAIYLEATNTAKELAHMGLKDMIPDSAGKLGDALLRDLLALNGLFTKQGD